MKKFLILIFIVFITGCFNTEKQDELDIYTSAYPIEFATRRMYGHNSNVRSIYPDGIDIFSYELTEKQIEDYSESDLFIFNSLSQEKEYTISMYLYNNNFQIIDAAKAVDITYQNEEVWLDPANYLKVLKNIKEGLSDIVQSHYLQNEINENYLTLRLEISNISATLRRISQNAEDTTLVIGNNAFYFLERFGYNIISLDEENEITEKTLFDVKTLINNKTLKYIFISTFEEENDTIKTLIADSDVEIVKLHTLSSISEEERNNNDNYITIMNENIEKIKRQFID